MQGADCLSKWVGEAERQLRLLFDQVRWDNAPQLTVPWCCPSTATLTCRGCCRSLPPPSLPHLRQAKRMQPSVIFFDEIDGLAPVRSQKQDQIHSSIVSTLLALMDGLDNRGQVVVIGATNRVDAIDPALRRPGRFDRELMFTLPNRVRAAPCRGLAWHARSRAPSSRLARVPRLPVPAARAASHLRHPHQELEPAAVSGLQEQDRRHHRRLLWS